MSEQVPRQRPSPAQAAALVAVARSTKLTGRAAVLAVVICAIALSLAYPVREYIAQRQQIDQLLAQQQTLSAQVKALQAESGRLSQDWYIEQEARDELHMCFPQEQCYEVVSGQPARAFAAKPAAVADPWYAKLWQSVRTANDTAKLVLDKIKIQVKVKIKVKVQTCVRAARDAGGITRNLLRKVSG